MYNYYMNKNSQSNDDNEVHKEGCAYMPNIENRLHLGAFTNCQDAVNEALRHDSDADGCYWCSRDCHKS